MYEVIKSYKYDGSRKVITLKKDKNILWKEKMEYPEEKYHSFFKCMDSEVAKLTPKTKYMQRVYYRTRSGRWSTQYVIEKYVLSDADVLKLLISCEKYYRSSYHFAKRIAQVLCDRDLAEFAESNHREFLELFKKLAKEVSDINELKFMLKMYVK